MTHLSPYKKALAAFFGAALSLLVAALTDDVVGPAELVSILSAALGAGLVYIVPNAPGSAAVKTLASALMAGLGVLAGPLTIGDGMTTALWLQVAIAAGTVLGVFVVPNSQEDAVPSTASTPARPAA